VSAVRARTRPRVAVVGGGFAGVAAVRALARADAEVVLVDRRGSHVFQPLLYRVALGDLEPSEIVVPLDVLLQGQENARLVVDEAHGVDVARDRVLLSRGALAYDWLVLAAGAAPAYLGHDRWRSLAPALHTLEDALEIRSRLRAALAGALSERDPVRRAAWLTFAVVGGGPTGVELAGGLAELACELPAGHAGRAARIILFERGERLLPDYPAPVGRRARDLLERVGVEVRTHAAVAGVEADGVRLPGERVTARTVLWAAGVDAARIGAALGAPVDGAGRLEVGPDLSLCRVERVFAAGDVAAIAHGAGRVPGTATAAVQAGRHAAENIVRAIEGKAPRPFRFRSAGRLAAVGKALFVGHAGPLEIPPALASLIARAAHARWLWPARVPSELPAGVSPLGVKSA
jgi:NADH:ubiquinone reductase (H+-translocating)